MPAIPDQRSQASVVRSGTGNVRVIVQAHRLRRGAGLAAVAGPTNSGSSPYVPLLVQCSPGLDQFARRRRPLGETEREPALEEQARHDAAALQNQLGLGA